MIVDNGRHSRKVHHQQKVHQQQKVRRQTVSEVYDRSVACLLAIEGAASLATNNGRLSVKIWEFTHKLK